MLNKCCYCERGTSAPNFLTICLQDAVTNSSPSLWPFEIPPLAEIPKKLFVGRCAMQEPFYNSVYAILMSSLMGKARHSFYQYVVSFCNEESYHIVVAKADES